MSMDSLWYIRFTVSEIRKLNWSFNEQTRRFLKMDQSISDRVPQLAFSCELGSGRALSRFALSDTQVNQRNAAPYRVQEG